MPPRPPVTTLAIHAWKEHGKPRPLSNEQKSTQSARERISRSLSYEAHLTTQSALSRSSTFEDFESVASEYAEKRMAMLRSHSVEDALVMKRPLDVFGSSRVVLAPLQLNDQQSGRETQCAKTISEYEEKEERRIHAVNSHLQPDLQLSRQRQHGRHLSECIRMGTNQAPACNDVRISTDKWQNGQPRLCTKHKHAISQSMSYDAGLSLLAQPIFKG